MQNISFVRLAIIHENLPWSPATPTNATLVRFDSIVSVHMIAQSNSSHKTLKYMLQLLIYLWDMFWFFFSSEKRAQQSIRIFLHFQKLKNVNINPDQVYFWWIWGENMLLSSNSWLPYSWLPNNSWLPAFFALISWQSTIVLRNFAN